MGASHRHHDHGEGPRDLGPVGLRRLLFVSVVVIGVLTVAGVAAWWPRGEVPNLYGTGGTPDFVNATITKGVTGECPGLEFDFPIPCQQIVATVAEGPNKGNRAEFNIYTEEAAPTLNGGDRVVLRAFQAGPGSAVQYGYADLQRGPQILVLLAAFVATVLLFARWHGFRAIAGLVVSLGLLLVFLLPSLLRGNPPLGVALAGGLLMAGTAIYVTHGPRLTTTVAVLGTVTSVLVITVLAVIAVNFAQLTGLDEGATGTLRFTAETVDLRGLLIAGIVVGSLGVLDDVTVTQVAAVVELRRADPMMRRRDLYRSAIRIGRDHAAAVVNTLVLAYAGASLPLLLLFTQGGTPFGRLATTQVIAIEIVRTIVGTIGLVLSVPVTTALATLVLVPRHPIHTEATSAKQELLGNATD